METLCLSLFRHQAEHNTVYKRYLRCLDRDSREVQCVEDIPFLPIELFRHHLVRTGVWTPRVVFKSSGTSGDAPSQHAIDEPKFYQKIAKRTFEKYHGPLSDQIFCTLLPSYQANPSSSLLFMADSFVKESGGRHFWKNYEGLIRFLKHKRSKRCVVLGVTYALLSLAEKHATPLPDTLFMETGGMKGRRKPLSRTEVHSRLKGAFQVEEVHAEYGMTECLSQAYGREGLFSPPPWMKVYVRDVQDPFKLLPEGEVGALNIVDMANVHSCCFLATDDLGRVLSGGRFEVLGRVSDAPARGCHLLFSD